MGNIAILHPVVVLLVLTAIVWLAMLATRVKQFSSPEFQESGGSHPETRKETAKVIKGRAEWCGDNFNNLLELPVLFYVLVFAILHLDAVGPLYLWLAWIFVIFRILHSLVHCIYNKVMHRFLMWLISAIALWAMLVFVIIEICSR